MSTLATKTSLARAQKVEITDDSLAVDLEDGRTITVPLGWYPRLLHGSQDQRNNWRMIGKGEGIHWPDLDEDISVDNLLNAKRSGENQKSFKKWLATRSR